LNISRLTIFLTKNPEKSKKDYLCGGQPFPVFWLIKEKSTFAKATVDKGRNGRAVVPIAIGSGG